MENENTPLGSSPYSRFDEYRNQPMSVGDWFITILITAIPLVGIIMLFIWAFSTDTNINKANWAKATLIWYAIGIVMAVLILASVGFAFFANHFNY